MSKRKLLLADDSITIQKVVNLTFADEGVEVIAVGDGDAAMIKFNESMPDLVLADVNMPGLDGYRMCEMIKQDDETKHIPVILLVGSFEPFDEQEAWRVGADDFLTKPFQSIRQLVTKVSDLLNPTPQKNGSMSEISVLNETETSNDWQFADTKELPVEEISTENLGDTGMDDEMIQTSQVNEPAPFDEVQDFISQSYSYKENDEDSESDQKILTENSFKDESANDFAILEPTAETELERLTDDDSLEGLKDSDNKVYDFADYETNEETVENQVESETAEPQELVEESETAEEISVSNDETDKTEMVSDWQFVNAETEESTTIYVEEKEVEVEETENAVAEESPISDEAEIGNEETEEEITDEIETLEEKESEPEYLPTKASVSFDDLDLLELPPLVEETGIRPQSENREIHTVAEANEPETETVETVENTESAENIEKATTLAEASAYAFPPELIEAIAQKVAERISDKAIRDIAWEVVPQMTDLIVKKIAEDQLNEKAKKKSE